MAEPKFFPMQHIKLTAPEISFDSGIFSVSEKIYADCIDMKENAVFDAVVRCAKDFGFTEAFLLDREFVLAALTDAAKKWRADNG